MKKLFFILMLFAIYVIAEAQINVKYPVINDPVITQEIYVDSQYTGGNNDGTITNPYDDFSWLPANGKIPANTKLLIKKGSTLTAPANSSGRGGLDCGNDDIWITNYGTGDDPIINFVRGGACAVYVGLSERIIVEGLHIVCAWGTIGIGFNQMGYDGLTSDVMIRDCEIENVEMGIYLHNPSDYYDNAIKDIWIENVTIHNSYDDAIHVKHATSLHKNVLDNLIIRYCHFYDLNYMWQNEPCRQGGDVIHFVGCVNNPIIEYCILDRSGTSGKQCMMSTWNQKTYLNDRSVVCNFVFRFNEVIGGRRLSPRYICDGTAVDAHNMLQFQPSSILNCYDTLWIYGNQIRSDEYSYTNGEYERDETPPTIMTLAQCKVLYFYNNIGSGALFTFAPNIENNECYIVNNTLLASGETAPFIKKEGYSGTVNAFYGNLILAPTGVEPLSLVSIDSDDKAIVYGTAADIPTHQFFADMAYMQTNYEFYDAVHGDFRLTVNSTDLLSQITPYVFDWDSWPTVILREFRDPDLTLVDNSQFGAYGVAQEGSPTDPPTAPTIGPATDILIISATITWGSSASGTPDGYKITVDDDPAFGSPLAAYNDLDVGLVNEYDLNNLDEYTEYFYRVRAYNTYGNSPYSASESFTTLPSMPRAEFSADKISVETGEVVTFTDETANSSGAPYTVLWTFPAGNPPTSTDNNPTVYWDLQSGENGYDITLEATNITGSDSETKTNYIYVVLAEVAPVIVSVSILEEAPYYVSDFITIVANIENKPTNVSFTLSGSPTSLPAPDNYIWYGFWGGAGNFSIQVDASNGAGSDQYIYPGGIDILAAPPASGETYIMIYE